MDAGPDCLLPIWGSRGSERGGWEPGESQEKSGNNPLGEKSVLGEIPVLLGKAGRSRGGRMLTSRWESWDTGGPSPQAVTGLVVLVWSSP